MIDKSTDLSDNETYTLKPKALKDLLSTDKYNKAELFDGEERKILAQKVWDTYDTDKKSRQKKEDIWKKILKLVKEEDTENLEEDDTNDGARINYPVVNDACRKWAKNAYPQLLKSGKLVKAKVVGDDSGKVAINKVENVPLTDPITQTPAHTIKPGKKLAKAQRRVDFENYYFLNKIDNYETSFDKLLFRLPMFGNMFHKVLYDSNSQKTIVDTLFPHNVVVNNNAKENKYTVISQELTLNYNDIKASQNSGIFLKVDLIPILETESKTPTSENENEENYATEEQCPQDFIEQHCWLDLDGDNFLEPYRVVIHKNSQQLMGLYPRFTEEDIKRVGDKKKGKIVDIECKEYFVKYSFYPSADGSYYDEGFGDLLYHTNQTVNTLLNQLVDAGTLSNKSTGFISKALKKRAGNLTLKAGQYKYVDMFGVNVRDAILPIDHKEPSVVLFELLKFILMGSKELVGLNPAFNQDMNPNIAPMTMLAFVKEGAKEFKATYKRVYRSLKKEILLVEDIIRDDVNEIFAKMYNEVLDDKDANFEEDFEDKDYDIIPLADADATTDFERNLKIQFLMSLTENAVFLPFLKVQSILQFILLELGFDNITDITQTPPPPAPDPELKIKEMELQVKQIQIQSKTAVDLEKDKSEKMRIQIALLQERLKMAEGMVKAREVDYTLAEKEANVEDKKASAILKMAQANKANAEAKGQNTDETTKKAEALYEPK
jgi:hypothetical protein